MRIPLHLLLLQLLPLLVFLAVDALVREPLWAIVAALVCAALQSAITFWQQRRFDRFILVDALLIGALGAASLISKNELFFRLKPAVIEAVMVPFLLVLAFARESLLIGYLRRYGAQGDPAPGALVLLRRLFALLGLLVSLHAGVVVYFALYGSRQAWAWVSGPGFYLLLVPLFAWILVLRWRRSRAAAAAASAEPLVESVAVEPSASRRKPKARISGRRR